MDDYGRRIIIDSSFDRTLEETTHAFREQGLEVISSLDVREYLRRELHHDFRRYVLLQVSAPRLMFDALREDLAVGPILLVTIAIHELADGEVAVVASEPFGPVLNDPAWREANPRLARLADDESEQIARALARLHHLVPRREALASASR